MAVPAPRRARRSRVLLLLTLVVVVLGAVPLWRLLFDDVSRGPTVHVDVVTPAGHAISRAQVQRRFAPGWVTLGPKGRHLAEVALPLGVEPSAAALATALEARAPRHAPRASPLPEVWKADNGRWHARFVLEPCGTVRLQVADTSLPGVRAWILPPREDGALRPTGGIEFARPGQPTAWYVFGAPASLEVRIEGATGVAARQVVVDVPRPGEVVSLTLEAEPARAILGRVTADGLALPGLAGRLAVTEIAEDGRDVSHAPVWIGDDGRFEVPYTGKGIYRLEPALDFAEVKGRRAKGGEVVVFEDVTPRAWLVAPWPADDPPPRVVLERLDGDLPTGWPWVLMRDHESLLHVVPTPGHYRLHLARSAVEDRPAVRGEVEVEVERRGPHPIDVRLDPVPTGTVIVRIRAEKADPGGARVDLTTTEARNATVLFAFGTDARFENLEEGPVRVAVHFSDATLAEAYLVGDVRANAETVLEVVPEIGGHLELELDARAAATARTLTWQAGDTPYGAADGTLALSLDPATGRLRTTRTLRPGRYEVTLDTAPPLRTAFEIRGGEAIVVDLRGE